MKHLLTILATLILIPATALAAPDTGFWEFCNSIMSGMGWMMLPMMIMPLLLITLLVLAVLALIKYLRGK
ncbi:hypothetical protein FE848_05400 [Marinobacter sp. 1-3A]|jgi:uncharacterized Tic20 family protein|uniref:hypothetical protein n=1 Tax=Marinobacter sp. 1-3A TaxID=2582920 RepID=UPI001903387C|nr:hypothetical protein [Marinobacter sp. 1-3A]MBK1872653.1 hypothetical protein [Marinobacter sp. 1-3A]